MMTTLSILLLLISAIVTVKSVTEGTLRVFIFLCDRNIGLYDYIGRDGKT